MFINILCKAQVMHHSKIIYGLGDKPNLETHSDFCPVGYLKKHQNNFKAGYLNRQSAWLQIERSWVQLLVMLRTQSENELLTFILAPTVQQA